MDKSINEHNNCIININNLIKIKQIPVFSPFNAYENEQIINKIKNIA
jgi:hypothetical protein